MATVYSWVITQLQCYPQHSGMDDVVITVHWRRRATDAVYTAEVYGTQPLTIDPSEPFTPYDQLTKEQVEAWLEGSMGAEAVAEMDAGLDSQIAVQITPPVVVMPLPWEK